MNKNVELLEKGRKIFAASGWERNKLYAVDILGNAADPASPDAVSYCALGALICAADGVDGRVLDSSLNLIGQSVMELHRGLTMAIFNDHYAANKEQILEIYDRAIEMAKEEE